MSFVLPLVEMLRVNPQLVAKLDYDRDVLHGYIHHNFPWFNICQETFVIALFSVVAQGEGVVLFLDGPSGSSKTFVYSVLLTSVRWDKHVTIEVAYFDITALLLEGGWTSHLVFKIPTAIGRDLMCSIPM
jgi:hypothetical protein